MTACPGIGALAPLEWKGIIPIRLSMPGAYNQATSKVRRNLGLNFLTVTSAEKSQTETATQANQPGNGG